MVLEAEAMSEAIQEAIVEALAFNISTDVSLSDLFNTEVEFNGKRFAQ